ncbi:MAG: hypothetical protein IPI02_04775 [Sterolibacteriaceae bacterium]|nr:hypothetical protein [Sterolibacteriaceae bacterium]
MPSKVSASPYGLVHRQGRAQLLLVLPDGSRSLIPTEWTDLHGSQCSAPADLTSHSLALLSDLLHARTIVDALLRRLPAPGQETDQRPRKERQHDATESEHCGGSIPDSSAWKQIGEEQQKVVIEVLARLIVQAALPQPSEVQAHD